VTTTKSGEGAFWRTRTALLSMLIMAAMLNAVTHAGRASADVSFDQKMLELVNQQRSAAGIAPLQWSDSLGRRRRMSPTTAAASPCRGGQGHGAAELLQP
jgi:hypothetical protein